MTDTAPLTDQQLADIRQRAEAATPGPWHLDEDDAEIWSADHSMVADIWEPTHASMNGEFIAHARQDVPALLAEVARLRAQLAGVWPCVCSHLPDQHRYDTAIGRNFCRSCGSDEDLHDYAAAPSI